jgi:hypothetical protein
VAPGAGHPGVGLKVELADEFAVLAYVTVKRRMVNLVHRDLEARTVHSAMIVSSTKVIT